MGTTFRWRSGGFVHLSETMCPSCSHSLPSDSASLMRKSRPLFWKQGHAGTAPCAAALEQFGGQPPPSPTARRSPTFASPSWSSFCSQIYEVQDRWGWLESSRRASSEKHPYCPHFRVIIRGADLGAAPAVLAFPSPGLTGGECSLQPLRAESSLLSSLGSCWVSASVCTCSSPHGCVGVVRVENCGDRGAGGCQLQDQELGQSHVTCLFPFSRQGIALCIPWDKPPPPSFLDLG